MEEKSIKYFKTAGNANTAHCLNIVKSEVEENGYKYVIVASRSGETGVIFAEGLKGLDAEIMVISSTEGGNEMSDENRNKILGLGATLFGSPSLNFYLDRAFGPDFEDSNPSHVVAATLERFGQGIRVACECVITATDGGLIPEGVEAIAVAGTDTGADTVAVIRGASSIRFRELKVQEILAKPRV